MDTDESETSSEGKKKGRQRGRAQIKPKAKEKKSKALPNRWTRVRFLGDDSEEPIALFEVEKDLATFEERKDRSGSVEQLGAGLLFRPKTFIKQHADLSCDKFRLNEGQLQTWASLADEVKLRFQTRARLLEQQDEKHLPPEERDLSRLAQRMHKSELQKERPPIKNMTLAECREPTSVLRRCRSGGKRLTSIQRETVLHKVLRQKAPMAAVAKEFRVS